MIASTLQVPRAFGSIRPQAAGSRCDDPMYISVADEGLTLTNSAPVGEFAAFQAIRGPRQFPCRAAPRRLGRLPVQEWQAAPAESVPPSVATVQHAAPLAGFARAAQPTSALTRGGDESMRPRNLCGEQPKLSLKASTRQFNLPHAAPPTRMPAAPGLVVQPVRQSPLVAAAPVPVATKDAKDRQAGFVEEAQTSSEVDDDASFEDSLGSEGHSEESAAASDPDCGLANPQTTLMIRNVPVMYTQEMLLAEWPNDDSYDFLYLPYSCGMQRNLTYAFMNFTSESAAMAFKEQWQKQRLPRFTSRKPLNISFADVQGRDENLRRLKVNRTKRVKTKHCQPLVFEKGVRVHLNEVVGCSEQMAEEVLLDDQSSSLDSPSLPMSLDPLADPYVLERFSL